MRSCSGETLGVRPVINAAATLTRRGGSRMPAEVLAAMSSAANCFVNLIELQQQVRDRIAQLTRNEACSILIGCRRGRAIAVAACIIGTDSKRIARLPANDGLSVPAQWL